MRFHATIALVEASGRIRRWHRTLWVSRALVLVTLVAALSIPAFGRPAHAADVTAVAPHPATGPNSALGATASPAIAAPGSAASYSNDAKARALVAQAINLTDSDRAVQLLWQATDLAPTLNDAYIYLGLFYNSRSDFDKVVTVYQKLVKYQPKEVSAYFNIGEAYMSFSPPHLDQALPYYRKALSLDPGSSIAELRIGEIYAQQGNRDEALRYLRMASGDRAKNPDVADQADDVIRQMGS